MVAVPRSAVAVLPTYSVPFQRIELHPAHVWAPITISGVLQTVTCAEPPVFVTAVVPVLEVAVSSVPSTILVRSSKNAPPAERAVAVSPSSKVRYADIFCTIASSAYFGPVASDVMPVERFPKYVMKDAAVRSDPRPRIFLTSPSSLAEYPATRARFGLPELGCQRLAAVDGVTLVPENCDMSPPDPDPR
jgi:hypothetical protein